nr:orotidine-5'-phosphate decarboxylase [uncultured Pseudokineococcus sp.]
MDPATPPQPPARPTSPASGGGTGAEGSAPTPFGDRLRAATDAHGPLAVGVDPHPALLSRWGLPDDPTGLERFALTCVEALGGVVAAVKPQSAFFERHGCRGVAVLERLLGELAAAGTLSLLDVKRGDVGSTMAAYAQAHLADGAPLAADAVTLSPYLGLGSLRPALDLAAATGRGAFVLALTSNPEGASVQHARDDDGTPVAAAVARGVALENAGARARGALGSVGMVVGATTGGAAARLGLDLAATAAPLLAPGVGAQGAGPEDLAAVFGDARRQVLATSSRGVLAAGPRAADVRAAARDLADRCAVALA